MNTSGTSCFNQTSISENNLIDFKVIPNPSNGFFEITVSSKFEIKLITIHDVLGKQVNFNYYNKNRSLQLDLSKVQKGTYFVKMSDIYGNLKSERILIF